MLALSMLLPLVAAVAVVITGSRPNLRDGLTVLFALLTLGVNLVILGTELDGYPQVWNLIELVPGVMLGFHVERLGLIYALVASGLWSVTSIFGFGYMRGHDEKNQTRFFACFAVAISAALAIAYSRNFVTLFIFYEVLTLSTVPLVMHKGDAAAKKAGRLYLGILMSTSIGFLLFAVIWVWQLAGTTEFALGGILPSDIAPATMSLLLALVVFGAGKAAVMPVHRWLPAAMVAPTPVSALLHAVAVVKAGVFTILKVVVYIFGVDTLATAGASTWLMWVATFTILVASTIAVGKDNLKARLAYSTISQLSYIVLGAAFATGVGAVGAALHIVMHAVGKITLFFCAGAIYVAAHKSEISTMAGLGRRMPLTMAAFAVGSASIIGLPFVGGMWGKWFLGAGALAADAPIFIGVLSVSSLLSIAYLGPVVARAFFSPLPEGSETSNLESAHPLLYGPPCVTAVGCIVLFFYAQPLYTFLEPILIGVVDK